jgi:hypothetical protein
MNETILFLYKKYSNKIEQKEETFRFRWICNVCKSENPTEYRYKCLICFDYDQCSFCFESRQLCENHELTHPMVRFESESQIFGLNFKNNEINLKTFSNIFANLSHKNVQCNGCHLKLFKGIIFKCDTCIDYDVCLKCYENKRSTKQHNFNEHQLILNLKDSHLELDSNDIKLIENIGRGLFSISWMNKKQL